MLELIAALVLAQSPQQTLFKEIDPGKEEEPADSVLRFVARDRDRIYFGATSADEFWRFLRSDGSAAGTGLVSDRPQAVESGAFLPDGTLIYGATSSAGYTGLFRTDGTPQGTERLAVTLSRPEHLTAFGGFVWFVAEVPGEGRELWRTDGTVSGTVLWQVVVPSSAAGVQRLFAGEDHLFAHAGETGTATFGLWVTDGSAPATFLRSFSGYQQTQSFANVASVSGRTVFDVYSNGPDGGWWSSDGTLAGTVQLESCLATPWATRVGQRIYFAGSSGNPRLRVTDGTPAGTAPVDSANSVGGQIVNLSPGIDVDGRLVHAGYVQGAGMELCTADGGVARLLADVTRDPIGSSPSDLVRSGDRLFFLASTPAAGAELWTCGLGGEWPTLVLDQEPGPADGTYAKLTIGQGDLQPNSRLVGLAQGVWFATDDPQVGIEPHLATAAGVGPITNLAADPPAGADSDPDRLTRVGGLVYFRADDGVHGNELWVTDGRPAGTRMLVDVHPSGSSNPLNLHALPDRLVFTASPGGGLGQRLWATDGSSGIAELLSSELELFGNPFVSFSVFQRLGDVLYIATSSSADDRLWRTDGTVGGTGEVLALGTGSNSQLASVNGLLLFPADLGLGQGAELCASDGTAAGTFVVADLEPGPGSTLVRSLVAAEGQAFFTTGDGERLYRTAGSAASTVLLADGTATDQRFRVVAATGTAGVVEVSAPEGLPAAGDVWVSDGTVAGTGAIGPPGSPLADGHVLAAVSTGGLVYFNLRTTLPVVPETARVTVWEPASGQIATLFVRPFRGLLPIADLWAPADDGRVLFSALGSERTGHELWASDGTASGTEQIAEIARGGGEFYSSEGHSYPGPGALLGSLVLFPAEDLPNGRELHAIDLSLYGGWAATLVGESCTGAAVEPRVDTADPIVIGATVALGLSGLAPGGTGLAIVGSGVVPIGPVGPCQALVDGALAAIGVQADASGASTLSLSIPLDPQLVSTVLAAQLVAFEPGGPFAGLGAISPALELVVGP